MDFRQKVLDLRTEAKYNNDRLNAEHVADWEAREKTLLDMVRPYVDNLMVDMAEGVKQGKTVYVVDLPERDFEYQHGIWLSDKHSVSQRFADVVAQKMKLRCSFLHEDHTERGEYNVDSWTTHHLKVDLNADAQ